MKTERDVRLFVLPLTVIPLWVLIKSNGGPVHLPIGSLQPLIYAALTVLGYLRLCRWWFPMGHTNPAPGIWAPFLVGLLFVPCMVLLLSWLGPGLLRVCMETNSPDHLLSGEDNFSRTLFRQVLMVGMVEEWGKRFAAHKSPESTLSGQVGSGFAAGIGFGVAEAVVYSFRDYNGTCDATRYLIRFISLVGLHGTWSAMSTFIRCHLRWEPNPLRVLVSLIPVALLHGTYNSLLTHDMPDAAASLALFTTCAFAFVYCVRRRMQDLQGELDRPDTTWRPQWDRR